MDIVKYIDNYLKEVGEIAAKINRDAVKKMAEILREIKFKKGRIFFLGVGGGAASGSHAANDFNKIAGISTVCLTDNAGLLTALANDEGWDSVFKRQLEMHNLKYNDCLFVFSVGGGNEKVSRNLVLAIDYAKEIGAKIVGVVGRDTGATALKADACAVIPCVDDSKRTPYTEDFQMIINHLLANFLKEIE